MPSGVSRMRPIIAAAALLAASPALAQQTPPPPAATAPVSPPDAAAEAAFQARGQAFEGRVRQMGEEMGAAIVAAGPDRARRATDLDAIQARYQPEMDAFATDLEAFVLPQINALPADQQPEARAAMASAVAQLRGLPATLRAQAEQAADTPPAS